MKKQFLGIVSLLVSLMLLQNACRFVRENKNMDAKYKKATQLENTGNFYYRENEFDSALKSYTRSLVLYKDLLDSTPPPKDTVYKQKVAYLYSWVSCVYDTLHRYDSALVYNMKSLGLIDNGHDETRDREILNHNIALNYKKLGDKKGNKTDSGKALYRKGTTYALAACWEIDSLGDHSDDALWAYHLAMAMYTITGDTVRARFYKTKYTGLNNVLHPATTQATAEESTTQHTTQKTHIEEHKANTDDKEDRFLKAFERGFERGLKKYQNNNYEYNGNSKVSTTADSDGTVTKVITTISGDVETIVTEVNGVVVKKETKRIY